MIITAPKVFADSDYVGSKSCRGCHESQYAVWSASAHARAGTHLGNKKVPARCLNCHTTGGMPTGRPVEDGVGCEACHGAGVGYAAEDVMKNRVLAEALGLENSSTAEAREKLCLRCHDRQTTLKKFDVVAGWKSIAH